MNYSEKIKSVWDFKNSRAVTSEKPSIEMSLWVGEPTISHHEIAYKLLEIMYAKSEIAYNWSIGWGLTKVYIGFKERLQADFSLKKSSNIKLLTEYYFQGENNLKVNENVGAYTIVLNNSKITFEGFVLQVQRMVDELVLSLFNSIKVNSTKSANEIYRDAAFSVIEKGITFQYSDEISILESFSPNSGVFVRLYGNVNKLGKVPTIIGSANIKESFSNVNTVSEIRKGVLKECSIPINKFQTSLEVPDSGTVVLCGIAAGKEPHFGHYLMLAYADFVRSHYEESELFVESNDYGPRIIGTVTATCLRTKESVSKVLDMYANSEIQKADIESDYINRSEIGEKYEEVKKTLANDFRIPLGIFSKSIQSFLESIGMGTIKIIPNTISVRETILSGSINSVATWSNYGIEYLDFSGRILLSKYNGIFTANFCRLATILSQNKRCIYVDCDESTRRVKTTAFSHNPDLIVTNGCYIGFNSKISSGSSGNVLKIRELKKITEKNLVNYIKYYIFTHTETVLDGRDSNLGNSFFDYFSKDSFLKDFLSSLEDFEVLKQRVTEILNSLRDKNFSQTGDIIETEKIIQSLIRSVKEKDFEKLFPKPRKILPSVEFIQVFSAYQKICTKKETLLDSLTSILLSGIRICRNITDLLISSGVIRKTANKLLLSNEEISFNYLSILKARGYPEAEIKLLVPEYLSQEKMFYKKRSLTFETLLNFCSRFHTMKINSNRDEIRTALEKLVERVSFLEHDTP